MRGNFKKTKNFKVISYDDQKYKLDEQITINNLQWRIAEYKFKYGRQWVYILQHETVEGTYKTLEFNEKTLTAIIESGSEIVLKDK
jgi:hypothetical protein